MRSKLPFPGDERKDLWYTAGVILKVVSFVIFYLSWFGAVYAPQTAYPTLVSVASTLPLFVLTLMFSPDRKWSLRVIFEIAAIGLVIDSGLHAAGYFTFPMGSDLPWPLVPLWYIPLWIGFACSLLDLAILLISRPWLSAILGSFGGPLSYAAGEKMGAIVITGPLYWIVPLWMVLVPAFIWLIRRNVINMKE